jgi:hypothetical protein
MWFPQAVHRRPLSDFIHRLRATTDTPTRARACWKGRSSTGIPRSAHMSAHMWTTRFHPVGGVTRVARRRRRDVVRDRRVAPAPACRATGPRASRFRTRRRPRRPGPSGSPRRAPCARRSHRPARPCTAPWSSGRSAGGRRLQVAPGRPGRGELGDGGPVIVRLAGAAGGAQADRVLRVMPASTELEVEAEYSAPESSTSAASRNSRAFARCARASVSALMPPSSGSGCSSASRR